MRAQIAAEPCSHIAERLAYGPSLDSVLGQLGDPVKFADSYLSAEPLMSAVYTMTSEYRRGRSAAADAPADVLDRRDVRAVHRKTSALFEMLSKTQVVLAVR